MAPFEAVDDEPRSYAAAEAELQAILEELEGDGVDVDVLTTRVRRARELITWCRARVSEAEMNVKELLAEPGDGQR